MILEGLQQRNLVLFQPSFQALKVGCYYWQEAPTGMWGINFHSDTLIVTGCTVKIRQESLCSLAELSEQQ